MIGRIVEIANDARHLALYRGFLTIKNKEAQGEELGRIPLDNILAVIAHAHGLSYTNNVLCSLAERGIPFVLCNDLHEVVGMLWPVSGHHQQAKRFDAQISATEAKKRALWAKIVRSKIQQQELLLEKLGFHSVAIQRLLKQVKNGDPENCEAQAARIYWHLLLGNNFLRNREAGGINAFLNYGYTVLRSAMARAVIAAGLHPSVGLHHSNGVNAMRLVDDLMEPFRPVIDAEVFRLSRENQSKSEQQSLTNEIKQRLVHCLFVEALTTEGFRIPVMVAMQKLATSLALFFMGETSNIVLPKAFSGDA